MLQPPVDSAFDAFATALDPKQRQQALSDLMTLKAVPKYANDPRFEKGISEWQSLCLEDNVPPEVRLLAIAELVRASQMVKKLQPRVEEAITPVFSAPIGSASLLKEADDRLNLARACSMMNAAWLPTYLAQSIAEEDQGEKARAEAMNALLRRVGSVAEALGLLSEAFSSVRFQTEAPADSMARRLVRTLMVFRPALLSSLIDAGDEVGVQFDNLIRGALRATGRPQEEKVQLELAREVALTLHDLVRTHFSVSTEPETFAALKYCRGFFREISWPEEVREAMEYLVQDVSEALVMLGRQDVPNQGLLDRLELVCGIKERAQAVACQLSIRHTELPERIREWLKRGRLVKTIAVSETLEDSLLSAIDVAVGLALIEARRLGGQEDVLQRVVGTLEIYDQTLAVGTKNYSLQASSTVTAVEEIAKRREISLFGSVGEEIDFSPKYFDLTSAVSQRRVVVRRPAVVRATSNGLPTDVVLKGLVE
jgi:hypothetical protein